MTNTELQSIKIDFSDWRVIFAEITRDIQNLTVDHPDYDNYVQAARYHANQRGKS